MLGINKHGQRIIAQRKKNTLELRKTFWSLYFVHLLASLLSVGAYIVYMAFICQDNTDIAFVQTIYVFSSVLDITWLFYGLEKFKVISIRNACIKIIETVCIFCFVKSPDDLIVYTVIMCTSVCLGYVIMFPQVISTIPPIRFGANDIKEHIKPLFTLFAAVVAVTLYTVFDKTLLGLLSSKEDVAYYEYSNKIINLPKTFISIIGTVLYPRACMLADEKNYSGLEENMKLSMTVTCLIGFASACGLASVADLFATIYYGAEFSICGSVMTYMCPLIIIIGVGETIRTLYLYPLKYDMSMVKILFLNAIVNLAISACLIPSLGIYGAILGTTAAEIVGLLIELYICRQYHPVKIFLQYGLPFGGIGFLMLIVVKIVAHFTNTSLMGLFIQVISGAIVYVALCLIYGYLFNSIMRNLIKNIRNTFVRIIKHH